MPRKPSIWFREQDGWYYTTFRRKQHRLARHEREAQAEFHRLMAEKLSEPDKPKEEKTAATETTFAVIANAFLGYSQKHNPWIQDILCTLT